jgi:hypothetical protein
VCVPIQGQQIEQETELGRSDQSLEPTSMGDQIGRETKPDRQQIRRDAKRLEGQAEGETRRPVWNERDRADEERDRATDARGRDGTNESATAN